MSVNLSSIERTVEALQRGEMVIIMDDQQRENEGDLVCAAQFMTAEKVNFMLQHARGQVCVPMLSDACKRLELPQMVRENTAPLSTQFTIPVDHKEARTGITAPERAMTIKALSDPASPPGLFVRPGHVFPLSAKEGGVLRRAGHTEAAVDLLRLADLNPTACICEILGENGDRADRDYLLKMAEQFHMEITTIEELIRWRRQREKLIYRKAEANLPTKYGLGRIIVYGVQYEDMEPVAVVLGDQEKLKKHGKGDDSQLAPLVRLHSSCFTGDLLGSLRCDCGDQLHRALEMIQREGCGALIYLPQEGRGIGLAEKIKAYKLQDEGMDTVDANLALGHAADSRDYGIGLHILKDLGIDHVRLLTNNPKKVDAFIYSGFNITVQEQVPIFGEVNEYNRYYIQTKRDRMGHIIPDVKE